MASLEDVARIASSLPETNEGTSWGNRAWKVADKTFVWERPLSKKDTKWLGDAAPDGPVLGARVEHEVAKQALLADDPRVYFTTPHFDGYPAILVHLDRIGADELEEVVSEAWLCQAPEPLAKQFIDERTPQ
jgi:hypothetical protein